MCSQRSKGTSTWQRMNWVIMMSISIPYSALSIQRFPKHFAFFQNGFLQEESVVFIGTFSEIVQKISSFHGQNFKTNEDTYLFLQ